MDALELRKEKEKLEEGIAALIKDFEHKNCLIKEIEITLSTDMRSTSGRGGIVGIGIRSTKVDITLDM